jgi:exonuclease SbcC
MGLAAVDARLQKASAAFRTQRDALVQIGLEPPPEQGGLAADWVALATWAVEQAPIHATAATEADARATKLRAQRDEQIGALVTKAREADVEVRTPATPDALADQITDAGQAALTAQRRVAEGIKERTKLEGEIEKVGGEVQVARELARLLDARNFERWLVAEGLELLVDGASIRLRELSGGQYSFAFEESSRDFLVVDHAAADERRSVRTLSGGETFQASLALALALSDQLAVLAPGADLRLGSIFLDEGFGTLDADTLDTVAGAIENLGAGDRMVGIVTHVPELAARMPVQYRVTRRGDGATVERIDA